MTKRIGILYFSPTNTTKKICRAVASGMGAKDPQTLDMTYPDTRSEIIANPNTVTANIDHLIVGAPVHSGKLPLQTSIQRTKRTSYYCRMKCCCKGTHK